MSIVWTKLFSSSDDGSILSGTEIGTIQNDVSTQTLNNPNTVPNSIDGVSLTNLANIPSGAGIIPAANLPSQAYPVSGSFKNLAAVYVSASTATVSADLLAVENTSHVSQILVSLSVTLDITASGAGGLDTGAEAANTIYYIWAIAKADGTKSAILSASASAPTLPAGYTYKALVSAVGNDNSSNFIKFHQAGKKYTFDTWGLISTGSSAGTWTTLSLNPSNMSTNPCFVPSALSTFVFGALTAGTSTGQCAVGNDSSVATSSTYAPNKYTTGITGASGTQIPWALDVLTANTIYYYSSIAANVVYIHGFEINKL